MSRIIERIESTPTLTDHHHLYNPHNYLTK
jgi:hypothetical protein